MFIFEMLSKLFTVSSWYKNWFNLFQQFIFKLFPIIKWIEKEILKSYRQKKQQIKPSKVFTLKEFIKISTNRQEIINILSLILNAKVRLNFQIVSDYIYFLKKR